MTAEHQAGDMEGQHGGPFGWTGKIEKGSFWDETIKFANNLANQHGEEIPSGPLGRYSDYILSKAIDAGWQPSAETKAALGIGKDEVDLWDLKVALGQTSNLVLIAIKYLSGE